MNLFNKFGKIPRDRGIIRTIIIIVVALLILSYFGYNLRTIANSPTAHDNFSYVGEVLSNLWNNYLKTPTLFVWNIFVNYIWSPIFNALLHGGGGGTATTTVAQSIGSQQIPIIVPNVQ